MMSGQVANLHALMPVPFRSPGRPDLSIEFVVDTGFTGFLTLPPAAVAALGLTFLEDTPASLANDQIVSLAVHVATILWNGSERLVRVIAAGRRPLLGTALLDGTYLGVDFTDGGEVTITARP
jgi:clan AA aspartic protease